MPRRSMLASLVVAVLLMPAVGHGLDITTCNQIVPTGEIGVLQNDLVCPFPVAGCYACNFPDCFPTGALCSNDDDCVGEERCSNLPAIAIARKGTLDMNDHSITAPDQFAVVCRVKGPCTITSSVGRGEITGSSIAVAMAIGKLAVTNVDIHDNMAGIYSSQLRLRATLTSVTANDNAGIGIRVDSLRANGVTANGNGQYGIEANGKLSGVDITANGNDWAGLVVGKGAQVSGLTATGNGAPNLDFAVGGGIIVGRGVLHLANSTVTGNNYYAVDEPVQPLDLISIRKPKLTSTTCDHSASIDKHNEIGPAWGVCASD